MGCKPGAGWARHFVPLVLRCRQQQLQERLLRARLERHAAPIQQLAAACV